MRGYKVVGPKSNTSTGRLTSWCDSMLHDKPYWRGKWRRREPGWGPMTVFEKLSYAIHFAGLYGGQLIYHAEYEPSEDHGVWMPVGDRLHYTSLPLDTVFADRVKLTKLVRRVV